MKVLIGITSKNRAQVLPKAIISALSQSHFAKEVWVYDDASSDNTKELPASFPEVKWILSSEPKGLVWARNLFMKEPGFDYFCSLDDDAWFLDSTAIQKALSQLEKNPEIGALGFDMASPDSPFVDNAKPFLKETNNFIGCGHIINLKAAKEINYYVLNPGFYGGEEKDLCIRLIDAGYKVMKFKNMYVWHDKTPVARDFPKQHRSGVCNDLVFTYRRTPFIYLFPSILIKIYKHLRFSITYKKASLTIPCIKGFKDFFVWLIFKKTFRAPVSIKGFKRFLTVVK